uniref:Prefoldin subunit 1 n=1 Tax=Meleagris gallopavo TaxID=9103 RepID=G1MQS7_MELGA
ISQTFRIGEAFTELQAKVIDTQQKVKLADIQIEQLSKTKKHAHLTDTEIMTLVDETRMYEGVGRIPDLGHHTICRVSLRELVGWEARSGVWTVLHWQFLGETNGKTKLCLGSFWTD